MDARSRLSTQLLTVGIWNTNILKLVRTQQGSATAGHQQGGETIHFWDEKRNNFCRTARVGVADCWVHNYVCAHMLLRSHLATWSSYIFLVLIKQATEILHRLSQRISRKYLGKYVLHLSYCSFLLIFCYTALQRHSDGFWNYSNTWGSDCSGNWMSQWHGRINISIH